MYQPLLFLFKSDQCILQVATVLFLWFLQLGLMFFQKFFCCLKLWTQNRRLYLFPLWCTICTRKSWTVWMKLISLDMKPVVTTQMKAHAEDLSIYLLKKLVCAFFLLYREGPWGYMGEGVGILARSQWDLFVVSNSLRVVGSVFKCLYMFPTFWSDTL